MKKNKGFAPIAIVIIIIAVLATGGVVYYKSKSSKIPVTNSNVVATTTTDCLPTTTPYIKVLSPNGGETYTTSQKIPVTWQSCNSSSDPQVTIILKSTQSIYGSEIATVPNTGSATITLPTNLGGGQVPLISGEYYKILTQLGGNAMGYTAPTDDSDNLFTINNSKTASTTTTKNYKNVEAGYSLDHPTSWQLPTINKSANGDFHFEIQNIANTYTAGDMEALLNSDASIIGVSVSTSLNGISFANYATIDDQIKDPRFVLPSAVENKLSYVSSMNIGGKNLRVLNVPNTKDTSDGYQFIYKGKFYNISFISGSQAQYNIDSKTFTDLLASFKLN